MSLDLATLKSSLETAFGVNVVTDPTAKANIQSMADAIATAIDTYVKTGTVNTNVTITTGPGAGSTGTGTGSVT